MRSLLTKFADQQLFLASCFRVLLVADPQILGEENENFLTIFDSDRHLHKTFREAKSLVQPDAVMFLGDLM
jgi:hypothetical protein